MINQSGFNAFVINFSDKPQKVVSTFFCPNTQDHYTCLSCTYLSGSGSWFNDKAAIQYFNVHYLNSLILVNRREPVCSPQVVGFQREASS